MSDKPPDKTAITERQFLRANRAMMDALYVADGMNVYELQCFRFNFDQFIQKMIDEATIAESARHYPMRRHDWGMDEQLKDKL